MDVSHASSPRCFPLRATHARRGGGGGGWSSKRSRTTLGFDKICTLVVWPFVQGKQSDAVRHANRANCIGFDALPCRAHPWWWLLLCEGAHVPGSHAAAPRCFRHCESALVHGRRSVLSPVTGCAVRSRLLSDATYNSLRRESERLLHTSPSGSCGSEVEGAIVEIPFCCISHVLCRVVCASHMSHAASSILSSKPVAAVESKVEGKHQRNRPCSGHLLVPSPSKVRIR